MCVPLCGELNLPNIVHEPLNRLDGRLWSGFLVHCVDKIIPLIFHIVFLSWGFSQLMAKSLHWYDVIPLIRQEYPKCYSSIVSIEMYRY